MVLMEDISHVKWFTGTGFQRACCDDLEGSAVSYAERYGSCVFDHFTISYTPLMI
jgi:hypothetical protein